MSDPAGTRYRYVVAVIDDTDLYGEWVEDATEDHHLCHEMLQVIGRPHDEHEMFTMHTEDGCIAIPYKHILYLAIERQLAGEWVD